MIYKEKLSELLKKKTIVSNEGLRLSFVNRGPATELEIENLSRTFDFRLPAEYLDFLLCYNGLELYKYEDVGGFEFFDASNLIEQNDSIRGDYDPVDWDSSIILFCRIIGEGNYLGFRIKNENQYEVVDCFHESLPLEWVAIVTSFDYFLNRLIETGDEKFWLKE